MEGTMEFTRENLPYILTLFLGWLYVNLSASGDPADISNRVKVNSSLGVGILLGIALMYYEAPDPVTIIMPFKVIIKYVFTGFLIGCTAIGLNQVQRAMKKDSAPRQLGSPGSITFPPKTQVK